MWKTEPAKGNNPIFICSVVPMRFNLMAYPSVKMKDETMSDQKPITSLHNIWSKGIVLVARRSRRNMLTLFSVDGILFEKVR